MAKIVTPSQRQSLYEQIVRQIGLSIMRNEFKPGDVLLNEPELSLQLNVSRPVLREALKMLGAKGLVAFRPRTGTWIRPRSDWNLLDPDVIAWQGEVGFDASFLLAICEIRLMLEPLTARFAAVRSTAEELAFIRDCCQHMQDVVDSTKDYIIADLAFHTAICAAAHNELLQRIMGTIGPPLRASRVVTSRVPRANVEAMPLHWSITEAICNRDEQAAEESMRQLVLLTTQDIQRALDVT
jgi:GntR family transcriptional regulator, galactonate operon transcriptional repressor